MSLLKDIVNSFSEFFSRAPAASDRSPPPAPVRMEPSPSTAPAVVGERVALKPKGYFGLAKEEIDKAVRAEWGLTEDAVAHYRNAQRVMLEAKAARVPDALSSRSTILDKGQVKTYQQKISTWQEQVAERLQVLTQRTGLPTKKAELLDYANSNWKFHSIVGAYCNIDNTSPSYATSRPMSSTVPTAQKVTKNLPSFNSSHQMIGNKKNSISNSRPGQDSIKNYDDRLVEMINTAIVDRSPAVNWDDVAGLDKAKQTLMEMVILPTKRRDLFTGLRKPARGLLLFGPPGNGKTMLAKAVASESEATFFNVSASSLTSKWVGEAEKLVRTLFEVAVARQPSVIFMDEIDSVLSARVANENDASRRLKSEFLVQFDGVTSKQNDFVIVIGASIHAGATNKPQELDDAVLRRLVKRIYIPLPDENVRKLLLRNQLKAICCTGDDLERLAKITDGYSGSDLQALCEEAAMMPIRELGPQHILTIKASQVRPLRYEDFQKAMVVIRPSLRKSKWEELERWNEEFGSS
ncbi:MIT (microtubule interacting and transport) domain [Musa troglodytarum]|uniref:microtubule-severing ATPase n=1 Tax=Musa troglodytarum TaxID=320322 RepID=A0A9E7IHW5_9LILI|nr:MIT (microtubule interacting and transport) domain [Musa troglodytarum]